MPPTIPTLQPAAVPATAPADQPAAGPIFDVTCSPSATDAYLHLDASEVDYLPADNWLITSLGAMDDIGTATAQEIAASLDYLINTDSMNEWGPTVQATLDDDTVTITGATTCSSIHAAFLVTQH